MPATLKQQRRNIVDSHERQRLPLRQRCFEPPTLSAVLTDVALHFEMSRDELVDKLFGRS